LLLDPTALVLSPLGTNAQLEYMLAARAWENGVFLAVANKSGSEGDGLEAVYVELPLALAWQKEMAPGTHIVRNRPVGQW
jgi:predicted amidohydrolase